MGGAALPLVRVQQRSRMQVRVRARSSVQALGSVIVTSRWCVASCVRARMPPFVRMRRTYVFSGA